MLQGTPSTATASTQMLPLWGQFLVHDLALTEEVPESKTVLFKLLLTVNCRSPAELYLQYFYKYL